MSRQPRVGHGFSTAPCMEQPSQPRHSWHGPVHPAEQSWKTAAPSGPAGTLATVPGLVALLQPTASPES